MLKVIKKKGKKNRKKVSVNKFNLDKGNLQRCYGHPVAAEGETISGFVCLFVFA